MKISFTPPAEQLKPYVASIWVFESEFAIPAADTGIIVPNGTAKILIPLKNPMTAIVGQETMGAKENHIYLAGLSEKPTRITAEAKDTLTLGVELTPKGLYHFFKVNMREVTNQLFAFEDLFGAWGARLQYIQAKTENVQEKISRIQNALIYLLSRNTKDQSLLDHTIDLINASQGMVRIKELETLTGYSKRYLDILFREHVGVSPKQLASIVRFQVFYKLWAQEKAPTFYEDALHAYYYDQPHFIKEFKRFTGFAPRKFAPIDNEFGRIFYGR